MPKNILMNQYQVQKPSLSNENWTSFARQDPVLENFKATNVMPSVNEFSQNKKSFHNTKVNVPVTNDSSIITGNVRIHKICHNCIISNNFL